MQAALRKLWPLWRSAASAPFLVVRLWLCACVRVCVCACVRVCVCACVWLQWHLQLPHLSFKPALNRCSFHRNASFGSNVKVFDTGYSPGGKARGSSARNATATTSTTGCNPHFFSPSFIINTTTAAATEAAINTTTSSSTSTISTTTAAGAGRKLNQPPPFGAEGNAAEESRTGREGRDGLRRWS